MKQKNGSSRQNNQIASFLRLHMITECCYVWENIVGNGSFKYFHKSAEGGSESAYGQLDTILDLEKLCIVEAGKWFNKADEAGSLGALQVHEYGMLLIEDRGDIERGKGYLKMADERGYC